MKLILCRMIAVIWLVLTVTQLAKAVEKAGRSGVSVVTEEEIKALKAKAEKGDAAAQYLLGNMYVSGQGVTKD